MAIDLKISHKMIRIIAVYLPHAGYDSNYFQSTLDDVERLIMEACDKRYAVVIGGDFNLSLDQGVRDRLLQDLCAEFSLDIANGTPLAENPNMWTFKTSWGNFNRLDYVLHSRSLQSSEVSANLDLDMGSDHRNVSVSISYIRSKEAWKLRTRSFKGWKPILDESKNADAYHSHLQKLMHDCPPTSLRDLGKIAVEAAEPSGSRLQGPKGIKRPGQSLELKDLVLQRKETRDTNGRRKLSKLIHKQSRKELRMWKAKWAEYLLEKFENTKYLQKIKISPIKSSACPIDAESFASFLGTLYSSSNPLTTTEEDTKAIRSIPEFSLDELEAALKGIANLRSADEDGIVVEMIKYANESFKEALLGFLNQILIDGRFDESWHTTILQMLPKDGDLGELSNWRPIALLPIFYKVFSKLVYNRISIQLFQYQSWDQHGFTPGIRIEDALLCAEVVLEYHEEFTLPIWMLSMDMRKAFDMIDHLALINALRSKGLSEEYISLLSLLYADQSGTVNRSSAFLIQLGVKQGDTLSAILFNCVLDIAFDAWLLSLHHEGIYIGHGLPRLTNIRYADDIMLYAKSLNELEDMTGKLMDELRNIGLTLNAKKTKILRCNPSEDDSTLNFTEISGEFVKILDDDESHKYLGKQLSSSASSRASIEFSNRKRSAWASFHKHKSVLLDHSVSLRLRLKYFDACIGPAMLFGMSVLPMTKGRLQELDRIQRKMMRRIVGWRRIEDEDWSITMKRMKTRLEWGQTLFYCEPWTIRFARIQWRYIQHLIGAYPLLWARIMCKFNIYPTDDPQSEFLPHRYPGHPRMRWDDHIRSFCNKIWPELRGRHWFDILCHHDLSKYEDEYVLYIANL